MKSLKLNILLLSFFGFSVLGQQEAMFQHYNINSFVYNPAYAGSTGNIEIGIIRNQKWMDFDGGLIANQFSISSPINESNNSIGLRLNTNQIGLANKVKAHIAYSYKVKLNSDLSIYPGISLGIVNQRIDFSKAIVFEDDPFINSSYSSSKSGLDGSFGLRLQYKDINFDFVSPQILGTKLNFSDSETYQYRLERQLLFNADYKIQSNKNQNLYFKPSVLIIQSSGLPLHYTAGLITDLKNIGWIGASYRSTYAISTYVGFNFIKNLKIGLAYDIKLGEIASLSNSNNFEIGIFYTINESQFKANKELDNVKIKLDEVVKEKEITDSIHHEEIDSLEFEINIKTLENKVLEDENKILKENPEIVYINSISDSVTQITMDSLSNFISIDSLEQEIKSPIKNSTISYNNHIKIEQTESQSNTNDQRKTIQTQSIKVKDDIFIDLLDDKTSKNGYYIVSGPYTNKTKSEELLSQSKPIFLNAKLVVNQVNNKFYIVLFYSNDINGVIEALMLSQKIKHSDFTKAWALNYFNKTIE